MSSNKDIDVNNQNGGGKKNKMKIKIKTNDNMKLIQKKSISKHFIKLNFPDIRVSQCEYREGPVGLTFIHCDTGLKVHKEIRGGWTGHIDCLSTNDKQIITGITISGGSLLCLESTTCLTAEALKSSYYASNVYGSDSSSTIRLLFTILHYSSSISHSISSSIFSFLISNLSYIIVFSKNKFKH